MEIVHVCIHVKPESVEAFKEASRANATASRKEPGALRFDICQEEADPTRFVFIEIYRRPEDLGRHKEMPHYHRWRTTVEDMMAEPRTHKRFRNISPDDEEWEHS